MMKEPGPERGSRAPDGVNAHTDRTPGRLPLQRPDYLSSMINYSSRGATRFTEVSPKIGMRAAKIGAEWLSMSKSDLLENSHSVEMIPSADLLSLERVQTSFFERYLSFRESAIDLGAPREIAEATATVALRASLAARALRMTLDPEGYQTKQFTGEEAEAISYVQEAVITIGLREINGEIGTIV
jgi:hypothetical protein